VSPEESVELLLGDVASETPWLSVPVRGQGPAGGMVRYTSTQAGQGTKNLDHEGEFCMDVRLAPGSLNTLVFEAVDPSGALSEPITIEVAQDGSVVLPEEETPDLVNVAEGAEEFDVHASFEQGDFADLVDGKNSNYATIQNNGHLIFVQDFLTFDLPEQARVERVLVHSSSDCPLEAFDLYLTDAADAGPLYTYDVISLDDNVQLGPEWVMVASVTGGGAVAEVPVTLGGAVARSVGIEFRSHDCGSTLGPVNIGAGVHKIGEVKVLALADPDADLTGNDDTPRCSDFRED